MALQLSDPEIVRALLARHGFHFSKSMGQNFLMDGGVLSAIVEASEAGAENGVLEIGPGVGALTVELARRAGKVLSVELDNALLPVLKETTAGFSNVCIISGDALKLDLQALAAEHFQGLTPVVCANLPYNITSPILTKLIESPCFESLTLLMQKEVAQRLTAPEGSNQGGWLSLYLQYHMEAAMLFDVPGDRFMPPPKVTSTLLRCVRRKEPAIETEDENFLFRVVKGGFLLRRKTLSNSLAAAFPALGKAGVSHCLAESGIPANARGERLTLAEYERLARHIKKALRTGEQPAT